LHISLQLPVPLLPEEELELLLALPELDEELLLELEELEVVEEPQSPTGPPAPLWLLQVFIPIQLALFS